MTTPTTPEQANRLAKQLSEIVHREDEHHTLLWNCCEQSAGYLRSLANQVQALKIELAAVLQQTQQWKQEARTQASIVRECYQACTGSTGEPGDWNGADPVRKLVAERDTYKKDAEKWASKVMAVVDIYFDGTENPPEHRAYVDGAFPATMNDLRIAIAKGVA